MVSPCPNNGAAQPIPGSGQVVVMTAAAIESTLVLLGLEPVAAALGPLLAGATFDLTQMCANDPPPDPGLNGQDVIDAANWTNPTVQLPAIQKVYTWFKSYYWYYACQCIAATTPPVPTPSNPGNPVSINTGLPYNSAASKCWDKSQVFTLAANVGRSNQSTLLLPQTGNVIVNEPFISTTATAQVLPTGVTSITLSIDVPTTVTAGGVEAFMGFYDINGAKVGVSQVVLRSPGDTTELHSLTFTTPANAVSWLAAVVNSDSNAHTFTVEVSVLCSGSGPITFQQPCCPPDPSLAQMVQQLSQAITLLQRQIAPFAYVPGTTHSGLSGSGELSVQGLIGVKVSPTSIPASAGLEVGDPDTLWLDSWINWGSADGFIAREFLRSAPYLSFPQIPGVFTKLGYTFRPGLACDILELKREP